jgi:putative DeoR family transcriptional regulator, stage III sporulation protein D
MVFEHINLQSSDKGGGSMQDYIMQRVMEITNYIMETGFTVRQTAQVFGVSKSTVHKDVTERLPQINVNLSHEVRKILERNKSERHLRGGEATRRKYLFDEKDDQDELLVAEK